MIDEFVNDLVSTLASSGGRALTEAAATAIGKLTAGLRERFRKTPAARGALEIVIDDVDDTGAKDELAVVIDQRIKQDPEFSTWLRTEWGAVQRLLTQTDESVANTVSGDVSGNVVQARSIDGGVHISAPGADNPIGRPDTTSR
jgi:hypothetical protein